MCAETSQEERWYSYGQSFGRQAGETASSSNLRRLASGSRRPEPELMQKSIMTTDNATYGVSANAVLRTAILKNTWTTKIATLHVLVTTVCALWNVQVWNAYWSELKIVQFHAVIFAKRWLQRMLVKLKVDRNARRWCNQCARLSLMIVHVHRPEAFQINNASNCVFFRVAFLDTVNRVTNGENALGLMKNLRSKLILDSSKWLVLLLIIISCSSRSRW